MDGWRGVRGLFLFVFVFNRVYMRDARHGTWENVERFLVLRQSQSMFLLGGGVYIHVSRCFSHQGTRLNVMYTLELSRGEKKAFDFFF